jgi:hypothetical protein
MRLMKPSPGEAYDRKTILQLKLTYAAMQGKLEASKHFADEQDALTHYMIDNHYIVPTALATELYTINKKLWDLEDAQRMLLQSLASRSMLSGATIVDGSYKDTFSCNAVTVIQLNDARAATVQKINKACGVYAPEKLHYNVEEPASENPNKNNPV